MENNHQEFYAGAGCFWHVESDFMKIPGVIATEVGYMGGKTKNPTYGDVCTHTTGHAEVVYVKYDADKISFKKLLKHFFSMHNPTTRNRQGPDIGDQYRSVIFYSTEEQKVQTMKMITKFNEEKRYSSDIVTLVEKAPIFYRAEEYHQKYYQKNRGRQVCNY